MDMLYIAIICHYFLVVFATESPSVEHNLFERLEANENLVQQLLGPCGMHQLEEQLSSEQRRTSALEETVRQMLRIISTSDVAAPADDIPDETGSTVVSDDFVQGNILHTGMPSARHFS
jgi:predicted GTPase